MDPADVLRTLRADGRTPAALIGEWGRWRAVIAPEPRLEIGRRPDGRPWIGVVGYPDLATGDPRLLPEVIGGDPGPLLLRDANGRWHGTAPEVYDPQPFNTAPAAGGITPSSSPNPAAVHRPAPRRWRATWTAPERTAHRAAVLACQDAIRAGDVYQVNVCTRYEGRLAGDPLDMFADLAADTAPVRAAYLAGPWGAIVSLSPETFLDGSEDLLRELPIKGTLPLDRPAAELRASAKDVAENVMIVDMVRNDLGRIARTGSVRTPRLLQVEPAPGVWHLVSEVTARPRTGLTRGDLLAATFPPASVTGAPKHSARRRITDWERHTRGSYCGAIGIDHPATDLQLNVAIRTVECGPAGDLRLGVGGGITIDSDPDAEWRECLDKAASIVSYQ